MFLDRLRQIFKFSFRKHASRITRIARDKLDRHIAFDWNRRFALFDRTVDLTNQGSQSTAKALF
jgi:hypothetical protein